jgi:hypothetical protein
MIEVTDRPRSHPRPPGTRQIFASVPEELAERLRRQAFDERVSQADIVRDALERELERRSAKN